MTRLSALRRRFIAIVMGLITLMLVLILAVVVIGNVQHYRNVAFESLHSLVNLTNPVNTLTENDDRGLDRFQDANRSSSQMPQVEQPDADANSAAPENSPPPDATSALNAKEQKAALTLPGMVVLLSGTDDDSVEPTLLFTRNMEMDSDTLQNVIAAVQDVYQNKEQKEGTINDPLNLSYSIRQTPEGVKIALVDRSYETSNIQNLLLISGLAFLVSWLLALFCVWRLSSWVFRPMEMAWARERQFIADASHELKTPLTVILANMRILENHKEDTISQQMRWIESSNDEALRMKTLVSDMLLLARNDAALDQPLESSELSFSDLVLASILSFESVALDQGLRLKDDIAENCLINGDKEQLQELVHILLDNACKYAKPESTISITLVAQDKNLVLSVHNKSEPFDEEALAHLFERFYRTDASRTRQTGGYGLGLAIAESVCRRHGGNIRAANEGDGVTFTVTLPEAGRHKK